MNIFPVTIKPVLNGWVVNVGCQEVVFTDLHVMLAQLKQYLTKPSETIKEYLDTSVNAHIAGVGIDLGPTRPPGLAAVRAALMEAYGAVVRGDLPTDEEVMGAVTNDDE